jgi:hypothetical protein
MQIKINKVMPTCGKWLRFIKIIAPYLVDDRKYSYSLYACLFQRPFLAVAFRALIIAKINFKDGVIE